MRGEKEGEGGQGGGGGGEERRRRKDERRGEGGESGGGEGVRALLDGRMCNMKQMVYQWFSMERR